MKNWNNTYRRRTLRDEQRRKKLEAAPPTPKTIEELIRINRRLEGMQ